MSNRRRRLVPYFLLGPGILWLILFFAVPMYFMGRLSLDTGTLETGFRFNWQWSNFHDALSLYQTPFLRSFYYAGAATVIALLIGYPLAYAIAFKGGRWKNAMLLAVVAPFFTTYLIRTIAWETILSDHGFVVSTLQSVGIVAAGGRILQTASAVIAGITYNFLPFMVLPVYASLERIDPSMIEAAKDLYASPRTAFWKVTLPLSLPGVVAGTLLTFIPAVGDYINAFFLGSNNNHMIGNVIQGLYLTQRDYPAAAALSFVLMAVIMLAVLGYIRFAGSEALMGEEAVAG
ncbi:MAG: spermidine/putrescine transport system permease protein [Solirubrobacterales bacterium]|jgi:spermidine/putrescine transport system permease protein|nr:spermidine/putrescine transport system permease protein [Solirubrobacterales bacterium]